MNSRSRLLPALCLAIASLFVMTAPAHANAPDNDNLAAAQPLDGNQGRVYFSLIEATTESGEPASIGTDDGSVWFRYSPSASGFASFSICNPTPYYAIDGAEISVFTGSTVNALTAVDQSIDGCTAGGVNAAVAPFSVSAGTDYFIRVGANSASETLGGYMSFDFSSSLPANDDFSSAQPIGGTLPLTPDADTHLATIEDNEPDVDSSGPSNSTWFRWTSDFDGVIAVDTCDTTIPNGGSVPDSRLDVYRDGSSTAPITAITAQASNDDGCGVPIGTLSKAYVNVGDGLTYWIRVADSASGPGNDYTLTVRRVTSPETTVAPYIYSQDDPLIIGQTYFVGYGDWHADPAIIDSSYQWKRCDAGGANCTAIGDETNSHYTVRADDAGHTLRITITADNGVDTVSQTSDQTNPVEVPPPPGPGSPGGGPSAPVDPFPQPAIPAILRTIKLTKTNKVTMPETGFSCGASATGPCTGKLTLVTPKAKVKGKRIKSLRQSFSLSVAPGAKLATTYKLSTAVAKAIRAAKKLKVKLTFSMGAPGFPVKSGELAYVIRAK